MPTIAQLQTDLATCAARKAALVAWNEEQVAMGNLPSWTMEANLRAWDAVEAGLRARIAELSQ